MAAPSAKRARTVSLEWVHRLALVLDCDPARSRLRKFVNALDDSNARHGGGTPTSLLVHAACGLVSAGSKKFAGMLMTSEQDVEEAAEEWVAAYYNDDAAEEEEVAVTAQPASGAVPLIFSRKKCPCCQAERVLSESLGAALCSDEGEKMRHRCLRCNKTWY